VKKCRKTGRNKKGQQPALNGCPEKRSKVNAAKKFPTVSKEGRSR